MEALQSQLIATTERKIGEQTARVEEKLGVQLKGFEESSLQNRGELAKALEVFGNSTATQMTTIKNDVAGKLVELTNQSREDTAASRSELMINFTVFKEQMTVTLSQIERTISEKLAGVESQQKELVANTEKKLEEVRATVDEKLTKTLHDRISQSFSTVVDHLTQVQQGLGDMKNLANDVGGLKKVLSNVKTRGTLGETQLAMLLEQVLSPEQFEANVRTKRGSNDTVEFAIKLPGKGESDSSVVYLPIDAKFPKDVYESLVDAYERAIPAEVEAASKAFEAVIKKMAKDINDKYIDPPNTTDFALMFLPFEGIYAEAIRRTSLIEFLQSELKIAVAGPSTLGAYLNSLQMGFRTLALQKRSSEVWSILGAVKTEFENFGGLLDKAQKSLHTATSHIDELAGTRTRAIRRKLKDVQSLPAGESRSLIPEVEAS
jgi:DNA recombination protein RmuC